MRSAMKKVLLAVFLLTASPVQASLINSGFESGDFTGWSSVGDVSVTGTIFDVAPTEGSSQLVITNSPTYNTASIVAW